MGFIVEHECTQCGAPVELGETDRLIQCPFCATRHVLHPSDHFRYVLPHSRSGDDIFYAPYLRFKGVVYYCVSESLRHRILDITRSSVTEQGFPLSLGLKPQSMKMRFLTGKTAGTFFANTLRKNDILDSAAHLTSGYGPERLHHRAYIGEVFSHIYLPLLMRNKVYIDAITGEPAAPVASAVDPETLTESRPEWRLTSLPALCPHCGWDLEGSTESVVLICENCRQAWEAREDGFSPVPRETVVPTAETSLYLPFWRIAARSSSIEISSYADCIRVSNQPRLIPPEWERREMVYWIPAFKIRPDMFLQIARHLTMLGLDFEMTERLPERNSYPVTLPASEALQSMKIVLAGMVALKTRYYPLLPQVEFTASEPSLIHVPFRDVGFEVAMDGGGGTLNINKKILEYARFL